MVREIDLEQVALNLEAAVRDVRDRHNQLVVVHKGQRIMAMIPVEFYDRWFAEREKAFQYFDEARAHPIQYSDAEVEADVERAIREVREKDAEAGGHNALMTGPPGAGKILIARALPGILPPLTFEEALDVSHIYSVAGALPPDAPVIRERPFRAPHHTISYARLVGGGKVSRPGEISLAHRGVLFLNKLQNPYLQRSHL